MAPKAVVVLRASLTFMEAQGNTKVKAHVFVRLWDSSIIRVTFKTGLRSLACHAKRISDIQKSGRVEKIDGETDAWRRTVAKR